LQDSIIFIGFEFSWEEILLMFEIKYFLMNSVNLVNPVKKIKII